MYKGYFIVFALLRQPWLLFAAAGFQPVVIMASAFS